MVFFEAKQIYYKYENTWINNNLNFTITEGELVALVGPSGCGKTTLLKIIGGMLQPDKGHLCLHGKDITTKKIESRNIGYVPQNQALFPHISIFENIAFGLRAQKWNKKAIEHRVQELAKIADLNELMKKPDQLSGGQKQRVALMRAIAPKPSLLLLDEPLSNIDAHLRENLSLFIRKMQKKEKIATIFVTHDIQEAKMLADTIFVMNNGNIIQVGPTSEVTKHPKTVDVAKTLGYQNIFQILEVQKNANTIVTEFGRLKLSKAVNLSSKYFFINPKKLIIQPNKEFDYNLFKVEILSIIEEPIDEEIMLLCEFRNSEGDSIIKTVSPKNCGELFVNQKINLFIPFSAIFVFDF